MKLRASFPLLALLLGVATIVPYAGTSHAQDDAITDVARQRYNEGVKAFDAGKFEDARSAFLQAYALKRHPAVLLNIGLAEMKSNHPEDAGNHLQQFLREFTAAKADERATAEKLIAEAKKKAARIIIVIDTMGVDVSVDGAPVGKSPVPDPVFVKPGKHIVVAQGGGKTTSATIETKLGTDTPATLTLGGGGTPPPVAPLPTPTAPPPSTDNAIPPLPPIATGPTPPSAGDQPPIPSSTSDDTSSGRRPFFEWYTHRPLAIASSGLAVLGLIGGIAFSGAASGAASSANDASTQIKQHLANPNDKPCSQGGGNDAPGFSKACDALRSDLSTRDTDVTLATVSWIAFGVGAVGTAAYVIFDWVPSKKTDALLPKNLAVEPILAPTVRGLNITGKF